MKKITKIILTIFLLVVSCTSEDTSISDTLDVIETNEEINESTSKDENSILKFIPRNLIT